MISYLGDFAEDETVYIMFNTFTSNDPSASCTITNFVNTDVHIHKDDGLTQRNNAAGITVSVNFDGITGSHMVKIDTSDDTVGGFWVIGHEYFVRIEGTTIDGATINAVVGQFSIQNRYTRGTDSAALAATALTDATWTDAKAAFLDHAISTIDTNVDTLLTRITAAVALASICTEARLAELDGANLPTDVANVKSETALIVADTNELQTDWVNGGRLDLILDIIAADTTTDIPATISTMQGNVTDILADTDELQGDWANTGRLDTILDACALEATVAALNNISTAQVNTECDTALTDYDGPTDTEMIARTLPSADYVVTTDTIAGVTTATNLTNAPTSGDLTATMKTSVNTEAKDVLTVDTIADSYATDGSLPTIAQAILAIQQMMQEKSITGTTLTVKKPDGSTSAMTFTLDSATTPTSITRAT